ncbi:MAG: AMP-binding protein, partial [Myxococcales bacterium]|nr:AMP-binding protein [Myxococcales bacterium]
MVVIFGDPLALVAFARAHSPYFAELYRELPAAPSWWQIPVVDPEHYWASKAEDFDATLSGPADAGSWLWTTGGSTSRSKYVAVSREDFCEEVRAFTPAFERAGLVAGDRVANLTWAGELSASFILTGAILEGLPVQQLPILGMGDPARILALCRELRPTALLTFPMVATRLAELLRARDEVLPVAKILHAGEPLHDDQRALLRERFACEHLACFGYGAVDCGPLAAADPERAGQKTVLRPLPGYALVEIL